MTTCEARWIIDRYVDRMEIGQESGSSTSSLAHAVTWFRPDRPVGGGTVYVVPAAEARPEPAETLLRRDASDPQ
jgi:hypothetical protein